MIGWKKVTKYALKEELCIQKDIALIFWALSGCCDVKEISFTLRGARMSNRSPGLRALSRCEATHFTLP